MLQETLFHSSYVSHHQLPEITELFADNIFSRIWEVPNRKEGLEFGKFPLCTGTVFEQVLASAGSKESLKARLINKQREGGCGETLIQLCTLMEGCSRRNLASPLDVFCAFKVAGRVLFCCSVKSVELKQVQLQAQG